jgi:hypothetical protein
MCAPGGHIVTTSLPRGNITLPAVLFTIGGRTHHAGQAGGASPMRDIPRFVELLDKGSVQRESARHLRRADRAHVRGLRRRRVQDDGHGDHDGVKKKDD